jgi:predicted PurR-regulated permease PerM
LPLHLLVIMWSRFVLFFSICFLREIYRYDYSLQNFEEAKSREIASDAPREVDTTIPGWVKTPITCLTLGIVS